MKKILIGMLAAIMLVFVGCGQGTTASSGIASSEAASSEAASSDAASSSKAVSSVASTENKQPISQAKVGKVIVASMANIEISAENGTVYKFAMNDKTVQSGEGIALEDTVEVSFKGDYKDGVKATAVTVLTKAAQPTKQPEEEIAEDEPVEDEPVEDEPVEGEEDNSELVSVYGTVIDATMNRIVIKISNVSEIEFEKNDNTSVNGEVIIGSQVEICYQGEYTEGMLALEINVQ